jgi:uncharacterized membrane-anchored protein
MTKPRWYRRRSLLMIGLVIVQTLFLVGLALSYYAVGWYGKEIRLQTVPIDPRDLLYGDYVVLNYDINQIKASLWKGSEFLPKQGKTLYVVLHPNKKSMNGAYEAVGIYDKKPSVQEDEVILKGRTNYSDNDTIHVHYGLEAYYISENTGKALEKKAGKGELVTKVKVASWGRAVIEDIVLP